MFGWIASVFNSVAGIVSSDVRNFVNTLIRGVYGFMHSIFGYVGKEWHFMWTAAGIFARGLHAFINAVFALFKYLHQVTIPWLAKWINAVQHDLLKLIAKILHDLTALILHYYHVVLGLLDALWKRVIHDIWNPLIAFIHQIFKWIATIGNVMWHYFTHLADFAELLFWHLIMSLEKHAWDAAKLLGEFFLALIVHNLVRFVKLMEDVFVAIL